MAMNLTNQVRSIAEVTKAVAGGDLTKRITVDVRGAGPMTIGFDEVADAKLLMTDRLIAATQPLSAEGAEEFEQEADEDAAPEEEEA